MKSAPLVIAVSLAGVLASACSRHETATAAPAADALPPAHVRLATVRSTEVAMSNEITGTIRPVQRAALAAKVMGTIEEMPAALGQRVEAGDVVARISAGEIGARAAQAQAQLNLARRDLERERTLLAKGASTADLVKSLEDRLAMTEGMVREAEAMLGYTQLRAPFAGVVSRKLADAGDLAAPGVPLLEIEGTGAFQVEAGIPDSLAGRLVTGASYAVSVPDTGASFAATLIELSSAADAMARTVAARFTVPEGAPVRSGQFARIQIPGTPAAALFAPAGAVATYGQLERAFVARDGRAVLRLVKSGAARDGTIEILAGLADGESVVVDPPAGLHEGQRLETLP